MSDTHTAKTFLMSFDDKEEAQTFRDDIHARLKRKELIPQVSIGIRYMHGVGGYAVELYHNHETNLLTELLLAE